MKKFIPPVLILVGFFAIIIAVWFFNRENVKSLVPLSGDSVDFKSIKYTIDGKSVTLGNSFASDGQNGATVTKFFGNKATGDLNGDGFPDIAFLATQNSGGSGTFFYVLVALQEPQDPNTPDASTGNAWVPVRYHGTNGVLLGDRIAPQTTEIKNGQVVVNYADRAAGEPMTTKPSVGVTKYFSVSGSTLAGVLAEATPVSGAGERCGGNMRNAPTCAVGYHCAPSVGSHLPFGDVGGVCVKN